jgi:hypothetical protein
MVYQAECHCHWPDILGTAWQPVDCVPEVLKVPPQTELRKRQAILEGDAVPWTYCITRRSHYRAEWVWGCAVLAAAKGQTWAKELLRIAYQQKEMDTAKPLTQFNEEKQTYQWFPETVIAFQSLEESLCVAASKRYPWRECSLTQKQVTLILGSVLS